MKRRGWILFTAICACASFFMWFGASSLTAAEDPKLAAARAQMAAKIKQALTAKEWTVYVVKVAATKNSPAVVEQDVVTFTDRTVTFKNLAASGYSKTGSNYALRVGNDGSSIWETMQMHENEKDIVFLRGELPKDCGYMTGSMVYQWPAKGTEKTELFSTYMPQPPAPAVTTTVTQEAPAVTTTGSTKKTTRTKTGW